MTITLPKPISVNMLYKYTCRGGFARSYISKEGTDWIEEAGYKLKSQWKKQMITGSVALYMKLYCCGRYDIDNGNKALFDLFTKMGVIKDDSQIVFIQTEKISVAHRVDEKIEIEINDEIKLE